MTGETAREESGWTIDTLKVLMDERSRHALEFQAERDRRYTEVALEREKALKIKDVADRDALELAREIQKYKDEKANDLRAQIESERGSYATQSDLKAAIEKLEATIAPLIGTRREGIGVSANVLVTVFGLLLTVLSLGAFLYFATH